MTAIWRNLLVMVLLGGIACAQEASLGDIARQLRASQKPPTRVITNDDIQAQRTDGRALTAPSPSTNSTAAPDAAKEPEGSNAAKAGTTTKKSNAQADETAAPDASAFRARYDAQKKVINELNSKLQALQKAYNEQTSQYWADAGTQLRNGEQWTEKRTKLEADIAAQQIRIEMATEKLDAIREQARRAGLSITMFED